MIRQLPARYVEYFKAIDVEIPEAGVVMTSVGPRGFIGIRWQCCRCGQRLRPNAAGAQSHIAKHMREADAGRTP